LDPAKVTTRTKPISKVRLPSRLTFEPEDNEGVRVWSPFSAISSPWESESSNPLSCLQASLSSVGLSLSTLGTCSAAFETFAYVHPDVGKHAVGFSALVASHKGAVPDFAVQEIPSIFFQQWITKKASISVAHWLISKVGTMMTVAMIRI